MLCITNWPRLNVKNETRATATFNQMQDKIIYLMAPHWPQPSEAFWRNLVNVKSETKPGLRISVNM